MYPCGIVHRAGDEAGFGRMQGQAYHVAFVRLVGGDFYALLQVPKYPAGQ